MIVDSQMALFFMPGVIQRNARRLLLVRIASRPAVVRGPVLSPPCSRQRPFRAWSLPRSHTAGARHGRPLRVRAPQRGRSARFIRGCLLRSLKAISYFQAITRAHDARAFFRGRFSGPAGWRRTQKLADHLAHEWVDSILSEARQVKRATLRKALWETHVPVMQHIPENEYRRLQEEWQKQAKAMGV